MNLLFLWLVAYVLPAAAAWGISFFVPARDHSRITVMHAALIVSIFASQYAIQTSGLVFPWEQNIFWFVVLGVCFLPAIYLAGATGIWYALSSFIQELTMCSIVFLLAPAFPAYVIILLVVPVFVACHFLSKDQWQLRLVLFTSWGIVSVLLFLATQNLYLIAALHTLFGAFLIRQGILYARTRLSKKPI